MKFTNVSTVLVCALLAAAAVALVRAEEPNCQGTYTDPDSGDTIDYNFNQIANRDPYYQLSNDTGVEYAYTFNVCHSTVQQCGYESGVSVCQTWGPTLESTAVFGFESTLEITSVSYEQSVLTYSGVNGRQTVITMNCDVHAGMMAYTDVDDEDVSSGGPLRIEFSSMYACPHLEQLLNKHKGMKMEL